MGQPVAVVAEEGKAQVRRMIDRLTIDALTVGTHSPLKTIFHFIIRFFLSDTYNESEHDLHYYQKKNAKKQRRRTADSDEAQAKSPTKARGADDKGGDGG